MTLKPPRFPPLGELSERDAIEVVSGSDGLGLVELLGGADRLGLLRSWLGDEGREKVLEAINARMQQLKAEAN